MSTSKTASGSPCKNCIKQGKKCHQHSPGKSSPKKSPKKSPGRSPKRSPKRSPVKAIDFEKFLNGLTRDTLQVVLMNMDRPQLHTICSRNRRAKLICDKYAFQEQYDAKHPVDYNKVVWYGSDDEFHREKRWDDIYHE